MASREDVCGDMVSAAGDVKNNGIEKLKYVRKKVLLLKTETT